MSSFHRHPDKSWSLTSHNQPWWYEPWEFTDFTLWTPCKSTRGSLNSYHTPFICSVLMCLDMTSANSLRFILPSLGLEATSACPWRWKCLQLVQGRPIASFWSMLTIMGRTLFFSAWTSCTSACSLNSRQQIKKISLILLCFRCLFSRTSGCTYFAQGQYHTSASIIYLVNDHSRSRLESLAKTGL